MRGFHSRSCPTDVYQNDCVVTAYEREMRKEIFFFNPHDAKKLATTIEGYSDLSFPLYEQALKLTSTAAVEKLVERYGQEQREYLLRFANYQLQKDFSDMENVFLAVEEVEKERRASLKRYVTCEEPRQLLENAVDMHRTIFSKVKTDAL